MNDWSDNDYANALKAAGADVLAFDSFGSYQGSWWALVRHAGSTFWVTGSYGSCAGCDAFQAEFGYGGKDVPDYTERLAEFGRGYLDDPKTQEEAEAEAFKDTDWDYEANEALAFIKANAIEEAQE